MIILFDRGRIHFDRGRNHFDPVEIIFYKGTPFKYGHNINIHLNCDRARGKYGTQSVIKA